MEISKTSALSSYDLVIFNLFSLFFFFFPTFVGII